MQISCILDSFGIGCVNQLRGKFRNAELSAYLDRVWIVDYIMVCLINIDPIVLVSVLLKRNPSETTALVKCNCINKFGIFTLAIEYIRKLFRLDR